MILFKKFVDTVFTDVFGLLVNQICCSCNINVAFVCCNYRNRTVFTAGFLNCFCNLLKYLICIFFLNPSLLTVFKEWWYFNSSSELVLQNVQLVIRLIHLDEQLNHVSSPSHQKLMLSLGASVWRCEGVGSSAVSAKSNGGHKCVYVQILLVHGMTLSWLWRYNFFLDCILTNSRATTVTRIHLSLIYQ